MKPQIAKCVFVSIMLVLISSSCKVQKQGPASQTRAVTTGVPGLSPVFRYWADDEKVYRARCVGTAPYVPAQCRTQQSDRQLDQFMLYLDHILKTKLFQTRSRHEQIEKELKALDSSLKDTDNIVEDEVKRGLHLQITKLQPIAEALSTEVAVLSQLVASINKVPQILRDAGTHDISPQSDSSTYASYRPYAYLFSRIFLETSYVGGEQQATFKSVFDISHIPFLDFFEFVGNLAVDFSSLGDVKQDQIDFFMDGRRQPLPIKDIGELRALRERGGKSFCYVHFPEGETTRQIQKRKNRIEWVDRDLVQDRRSTKSVVLRVSSYVETAGGPLLPDANMFYLSCATEHPIQSLTLGELELILGTRFSAQI